MAIIGVAIPIAEPYGSELQKYRAEFGDPMGLEMHGGFLGLSWVAVWVVLFTVVVPTTPRRAVLAALASVQKSIEDPTTTHRVTATGTLNVLGRPAGDPALRSRVGYLTQAPSVYADLTGRQNQPLAGWKL